MAHAAPMYVGYSPCEPYNHTPKHVEMEANISLAPTPLATGAEWPKLWLCGRLPGNFRWSRFLASKGGSWGPGFTSSHLWGNNVCMCNVRIPLWIFNPVPPNNFLILVPWNLRGVGRTHLQTCLRSSSWTSSTTGSNTRWPMVFIYRYELSRLLLFDFLV